MSPSAKLVQQRPRRGRSTSFGWIAISERDVIAAAAKAAHSFNGRRTFRRYVPAYFFINSITAVVIAVTARRMVGSGMGANLLECKLGSGLPLFLLSAILAGSTAPT